MVIIKERLNRRYQQRGRVVERALLLGQRSLVPAHLTQGVCHGANDVTTSIIRLGSP